MKQLSKTMICIVMTMMLIGGTAVYAISPSQGLRGSQNEILSRVGTFAGNGAFAHEEGQALSASFRTPYSIVTLPDDSVLVSDSENQLIRLIKDGEAKTYAGITLDNNEFGIPQGGWSDGDKEMAVFSHPSGMTADEKGNVYIADAENSLIRMISVNGKVTTIAGDGFIGDQDGIGENARFYYPQDVVVAKDGTLYVADTLNHLIRKITVNGEVSTLNAPSTRSVEVVDGSVEPAGDYLDGDLQDARFNEPSGLALDSAGNLYVSDTGNQLIRYIDFAANKVSTVAGNLQQSSSISQSNTMFATGGYADGSALEASFNAPKGLAVTKENGVLIADSLNNAIRYLLDGHVSTLAGDPKGSHGNDNGINGHNRLHNPTDVAVQQDGSILIADSNNQLIRELTLYQLPGDLTRNDQVKVVLHSKVIPFEEQPLVINGFTLIPINRYAEVMNYSLQFDNDHQTIHVKNGDVSIAFTVGQPNITISKPGIDKIEKIINAIPFTKGSEIYIPLRILSEEFGLDVQWYSTNRTVILREKE